MKANGVGFFGRVAVKAVTAFGTSSRDYTAFVVWIVLMPS
jgi:hypothetical protein